MVLTSCIRQTRVMCVYQYKSIFRSVRSHLKTYIIRYSRNILRNNKLLFYSRRCLSVSDCVYKLCRMENENLSITTSPNTQLLVTNFGYASDICHKRFRGDKCLFGLDATVDATLGQKRRRRASIKSWSTYRDESNARVLLLLFWYSRINQNVKLQFRLNGPQTIITNGRCCRFSI